MAFQPKKIFANGKEYPNLASLPDTLRKLFQDADKNGIPDLLEGKIGGLNIFNLLSKPNPSPFMVKGNAYQAFEDLPPEFQNLLRDKLGFTGSDFAAAKQTFGSQIAIAPSAGGDYTKVFIGLALVIGLFLFAAGGAIFAYFFLRN